MLFYPCEKPLVFEADMRDYAPLVMTIPVGVLNSPRVFCFPGCHFPARTVGTGNTCPHGSEPCSPDETRLVFFRVHALLEDDRASFILRKGAAFAGEIWDEEHKRKDA